MGAILAVKGLRVQFRSRGHTVQVVNGVSFEVAEAETLGLVGESGCGKSVTALSLMRLIPDPPGRITSGQAWLEGQDLLALNDSEIRAVRGNRIAMVFQDPMTSLNPVLSVGRQITEALRAHRAVGRAAAERRAVELLELVGIPAARRRAGDYPHQFSGGMRQRVMIAMALSCDPRLLIADEPTTALDVTVQAQILELLKRLQQELRMSMILITHDLGVVAGVADRIHVMYAGHMVETAPVDDLFHDPRHPYTLGLLRSIPNVETGRREKLVPILGSPPDPADPPAGCPFEPRCPHRVEVCASLNPDLEAISELHSVACWVDVAGDGARSRQARAGSGVAARP